MTPNQYPPWGRVSGADAGGEGSVAAAQFQGPGELGGCYIRYPMGYGATAKKIPLAESGTFLRLNRDVG